MNTVFIFRIFLTAALLLSGIVSSWAQMTEEERQQLQQTVEKLKEHYKQKQAELERLSRELNIPLTIQEEDRLLVLTDIVNGHPIYDGNLNVNSMISVSADHVKAGGALGLNLTGAGQLLGVWEAFESTGNAGVRVTHQEFVGRATQINPSGLSDHATHVAGTMIAAGVNANLEGFSSGAMLRCFDSNNDLTEMGIEALAIPPVGVSNHSYGSFAGWDWDAGNNIWRWWGIGTELRDWKFGAYIPQTQAWDNLAFTAPFLLIVKSAGNDLNDTGPGPGGDHFHGGDNIVQNDTHAPDGPFDCIPTYGTAKNVLTVGAVNNVPGGYVSPAGVALANFSSTGPTDDGRIKPDLVAMGVFLISAGIDDDMDFFTSSGTSMAAPSVAGSAGLLLEHWGNEISGGPPRATTMKGLMIHTANECGPAAGPDYRFGWGLLNVSGAARLITTDAVIGCVQIIEGIIDSEDVFTFDIHSSGLAPLRASLVWADPPSPVVNNNILDPVGANYLVNDLDLRITQGAANFFPWVLDPANPALPAGTGVNTRDNVEQVFIANPDAGMYTIEIQAPVMAEPQRFSLLISGNDAVLENLTISFVTINNRRRYAARNQIIFGPDVQVVPPADVEAVAGSRVRLLPGFSVAPGARFRARIQPGGGCVNYAGLSLTGGSSAAGQANMGMVSTYEEKIQKTESPQNMVRHFQIAPNPADHLAEIRFGLESPSRAALKIVNGLGQTVLSTDFGGQPIIGEQVFEFSTSSFSPGIYFAILETEKGRHTARLAVQH